MSDSSTSAIDDKDNENNNNSDDSESDNWGGFALSLLQTSIFYFLVVLFASGYIFWTRVPYQLIMEIFPTLDSKFGREFYCPESCKKGRTQHKEELKKRATEIKQRRKEREQNRMMESQYQNERMINPMMERQHNNERELEPKIESKSPNKKEPTTNNAQGGRKAGGVRRRGGSAKCSQAKQELEKTHQFKISTPTGMMSFPYNLNDGNPSKMGTWFASSTQWVYIIYRKIIVTLLGWEVVKPEDSSNNELPDQSDTKNPIPSNNTTPVLTNTDSMAQPTSENQETTVNTDSMAQPTSENQETTLKTDSIPEPISVDQETSVNTGPKLPPTAENTDLTTVDWQQGGAGEDSEIELPDLNKGEPGEGALSSANEPSESSVADATSSSKSYKGVSTAKMFESTDLPDLNMPKITTPSFLNEDREDDTENTMTNRFATYPGPLLFLMSMGLMLYFITLILTTGLLTFGSGFYACWNAGFPWGFGYLLLFFFMAHFMGGINIVYQFFTGLYYFLIYPFIVNPSAVGEKFKYYPGFICSCNAGFLLVIYGLFVLMAAGSNLTGSTQVGLGIGYYCLMILGIGTKIFRKKKIN